MKSRKFYATAALAVTLTFFMTNVSSAWEESDLPDGLGSNINTDSNGYQYVMNNTFTDSETGWTDHMTESGQTLRAHIDAPAGLGDLSPDQKKVSLEISNWQNYDNPLEITGGSGRQIGDESGTIRLNTTLQKEAALTVANYNANTKQRLSYQDGLIGEWNTHQTDMAQSANCFFRDYDPLGDGMNNERTLNLQQEYNRAFEMDNGGTINQGAFQHTFVTLNPSNVSPTE